MYDERGSGRGTEKIWNQAKSRSDFTFKGFLVGFLQICGAGEKTNYRHVLAH
jgi:hypothetical protein